MKCFIPLQLMLHCEYFVLETGKQHLQFCLPRHCAFQKLCGHDAQIAGVSGRIEAAVDFQSLKVAIENPVLVLHHYIS